MPGHLVVVVEVGVKLAPGLGTIAFLARIVALAHHAAHNQGGRAVIRQGIERLEDNGVVDFACLIADRGLKNLGLAAAILDHAKRRVGKYGAHGAARHIVLRRIALDQVGARQALLEHGEAVIVQLVGHHAIGQ